MKTELNSEQDSEIMDLTQEMMCKISWLDDFLKAKIRDQHPNITDEEMEDALMDAQMSIVYEVQDSIIRSLEKFKLYND